MSAAAAQGFACSTSFLNQLTSLVGDAAIAHKICTTTDVTGLTPYDAVTRWTIAQVLQTQQAVQEAQFGVDTAFLLTSTYQVFVMQMGFALYAAGVIRGKNLVTILMKSFSDACLSAIIMYLLGYALAFGHGSTANGFIGNNDFALSVTATTKPENYRHWLWNWAFAAAATTILSGSIAERATYVSYVIYCIWITAFVYPVVVHWLWSTDGWLSPARQDLLLGSGAIDFAGSGVVHLLGGTASIVACILLGPRMGRFDPLVPERSFQGVSPPLYLMGTFFLWFGWYGFNPGSILQVSTYKTAIVAARTATTTTLAPAAGAISTMLLVFYHKRTWDLLATCTGAIAGLVAVTSGCSVVEPWASIIAGIMSGPLFVYSQDLLAKLKIDDAISAIPVHAVCGIWGLLFVGLLAKKEYVAEVYPGNNAHGIFYGAGGGPLLLCQVIATLVIIIWSATTMFLLFYILSRTGLLRVRVEHEAMGLDQAVMGGGTVSAAQVALDPRVSACKVGTSDTPSRLPVMPARVTLKDVCIPEDPHLEPAIIEESCATYSSTPASREASATGITQESKAQRCSHGQLSTQMNAAFHGIIGGTARRVTSPRATASGLSRVSNDKSLDRLKCVTPKRGVRKSHTAAFMDRSTYHGAEPNKEPKIAKVQNPLWADVPQANSTAAGPSSG